jgi:hypothetical protein
VVREGAGDGATVPALHLASGANQFCCLARPAGRGADAHRGQRAENRWGYSPIVAVSRPRHISSLEPSPQTT